MSKNKSKSKSVDKNELDVTKDLLAEWISLGQAHSKAMEKVAEIQAAQDKIVQTLYKRVKKGKSKE